MSYKIYNIQSNEVLLKNILSDNFQKMLFPFNVIEKMFFLSKCKIQNNFVTPNRFMDNVISLIFVSTVSLLHVVSLISHLVSNNAQTVTLIVVAFINLLLYCTGFFLHFICKVVNTNVNVEFLLKLQHIYHCLYKTETCIKSAVLKSRLQVYFLVISNFVAIFWAMYFELANYIDIIIVFVLLHFDVDMIYASMMIQMIEQFTMRWLEMLDSIEENNDWNKLFEVYLDLLQAYELFKKIFKLSILFYVIQSFLVSLINIQLSLDKYRMNSNNIDTAQNVVKASLVIAWIIKNYYLQIILSLSCERFNMSVERVSTACTIRSATTTSDAVEKTCKNIVRVNSVRVSAVSACGMFPVDADLPLRLAGLLATYTIVLLQFIFLK
nr:gustatory receptor 27 [Achelura yunnanensis]